MGVDNFDHVKANKKNQCMLVINLIMSKQTKRISPCFSMPHYILIMKLLGVVLDFFFLDLF